MKAAENREFLERVKEIKVIFRHYEHRDGEERDFVPIGGTEKNIQMSPVRWKTKIEGKGSFTWKAAPLTDTFWYPFDSYKIYVNPGVHNDDPSLTYETSESNRKYFNSYADKMSLEFAGTNLVSELTAKQYDDPKLKVFGDPFEINLYRPFLARAYTVFVIVLMAFGLVYLYFFKDIEGSAGDLLGFFVAALGTRTILPSGVDFSPVLLDYVVVFFSILGDRRGLWAVDRQATPA